MDGIGLVLAGGGGKGAYQVGVWRYLHKVGLDQYISAVSGTSVGALNAAMIAAGDLSNAEYIWRNIKPTQILTPRSISIEDVTKALAVLFSKIAMKNIAPVSMALLKRQLPMALYAMLSHRYSFSRDGLLELMNSIDMAEISIGQMPCFATAFNVNKAAVDRFDLRCYEVEDMKKILLATSAIPLVFPSEEFKDDTYYDGGLPIVGDNIPVQPLYDLGCRKIVVIHLKQDVVVNKDQYPDAQIIEIIPSEDLGSLVNGTMDFTSDGASWRMSLGERDAERVLSPFLHALVHGKQMEIINGKIRKQSAAYDREFRIKQTSKAEMFRKMQNDGIADILSEIQSKSKYIES